MLLGAAPVLWPVSVAFSFWKLLRMFGVFFVVTRQSRYLPCYLYLSG